MKELFQEDFSSGNVGVYEGAGTTVLSVDSEELLVETDLNYGNAILKRTLIAGENYTFSFDLGSYAGGTYPGRIDVLIKDQGGIGINLLLQTNISSGAKTFNFTTSAGTAGEEREVWLMVYVPASFRTATFHYTLDNVELYQTNVYSALADVQSAQDYYPFGMTMPGRVYNGGDYRYGFNGMEQDNEVKGNSNSLDF